MAILVLGAGGMAGHMVHNYFLEKGIDSIGITRQDFDIHSKDWPKKIGSLNEKHKISHIINCIGVLRHASNSDPIKAIEINSLFPHELAHLCTLQSIKLIHLSTDCWNDLDVYGRSKRAGEIDYDGHITLRTSIIGPELKKGSGLFDWAFFSNGSIKGYSGHIWDGITTLKLSQIIMDLIKDGGASGIIDVRSKQKISKYELLVSINRIFGLGLEIMESREETVDKTMEKVKIEVKEPLNTQIEELLSWMDSHKPLYPKHMQRMEFGKA